MKPTHEFMRDIPEGLSMALAQNIYAMQYFSALPEDRRRELINCTAGIESKEEMRDFVNGLIAH